MEGKIKKIKLLLENIKIPDEEKSFILEKLPISTEEQLNKLEDILLRRLAVTIHFEFIKKAEEEKKELSDDDIKAIQLNIEQKIAVIKDKIYSQMEIDKIKTEIADTTKSPQNI
jgi:hypothetical protein